ncbi:MAG: hypothetical protein WAT79_02730 [Saprospiraceae bacterium]
MFRLSFIILLILFISESGWSQTPHGKDFVMDCALCHHPDNWSYVPEKSSFSHDNTDFSLKGRHAALDCRSCHQTLEFKQAESSCISCHDDVHQQTVGNDCSRCHNSNSWIVENITELHEATAFPLIGVHAFVNCSACHISETNIRFSPIGVTCYDCHRNDFINTLNPNHVKNNFDTDCAACHSLNEKDWTTNQIDHSFFPLELGHQIMDCAACHKSDLFSDISKNCFACHQQDFENASTPNHTLSGFGNDCTACHTLSPGWNPATFLDHDVMFFPIYSGKHKDAWTSCTDCHIQKENYKIFSCTVCHMNPETNEDHKDVVGYSYQDNACLVCHPTGNTDMAFNHNDTNFPLTGAHRMAECIDCHQNGYEGTPTECIACHTLDFNQSVNPDHKMLGLSTDCILCHSTEPGWSPAAFSEHDTYYTLIGAHDLIRDDCASCHNGNYTQTPNTCYGCHNDDYNSAKQPDHQLYNFSMDCTTCHNENLWRPSTFDHDISYFPIYIGKHNGHWNDCIDCHTTPGDLRQFSCTVCHMNPQTDIEHQGVNGYVYQSDACLACHPTGDADVVFDHNMTGFPLEGEHIGVECILCHQGGFEGTSSRCIDCHTKDYDESLNPNHNALGIEKECQTCHTTSPDWVPALFPVHNEYYTLLGAHQLIANDCIACHNGDYNNTPNTCYGCHNQDYEQAKNPDHIILQFPINCTQCHSEQAWTPSTFDHDGLYFPIYSGKHAGEWNECNDCHNVPGNWAQFTCTTCHQNPETDDEHFGVPGYIYQSTACLACHPTGDADLVFDHNMTSFPLTGAHLGVACLDCHGSGFNNTSTTCVSCHTTDFEASLNPNHVTLGISTECIDCHTTTPGWSPALFPVHDQYYPIQGAHIAITNDCVACHNGKYNNTPNTCFGCHAMDYNETIDPDHEIAMLPTDCVLCHTQNAWTPAQFDHAVFWPLTGAHITIKDNCIACHNGNYASTSSDCVSCHQSDYDQSLNPNHNMLMLGTNCVGCHTTSPGWSPALMANHNDFYIIEGAHLAIANDCVTCHNGDYNNTPNTCVGCHMSDFTNTVDPDHEIQQFPMDCASCHNQQTWIPSSFDHNTIYPFEGAHVAIANDCIACHQGNYSNTPNTCFGCHQDDYNNTTNPDHEQGNFPTNCIVCHAQNAWMPALYNHDVVYPLTGAHAAVADQCVLCHIGGYSNTPNTCVGCHQEDFNVSVNPNHNSLNFPTDCALCHNTSPGWNPAQMPNHNDYYVLAGAHIAIANDCAACHNGDYNNTPNTCIGCHTTDYNAALDPNHIANQFPMECILCHTQDVWTPSSFDHNNYYPLTGAHLTIANDCIACHNGDYTSTPNTCSGCHTTDYNQTVNPNHIALGLSLECATCHTTNPGWQPANFPIHDNYYIIQGAHIGLECVDCHNGDYNNTPNTCIGCHTADYNSALDPNHSANQFPTDCILCHSQDAWTPSTFNHNDYYPLTGAHLTIANDCVICHMGNYNNTPNTCNDCHNSDFNSALNPNHVALNLPNDCVLCHTTVPGWQPATFPIHGNYYVLAGAHLSLECVDCHNGDYNNTPNTCVGCHLTDYQNTNNPDHEAAQFPTDCTACHGQNAWTPATFNHDNMYFPIYSGKHEGEWNLCSDCHLNPNNYSLFSCIDCHEHDNQGQVDDDHEDVPGYQYVSNACYACHPTGED